MLTTLLAGFQQYVVYIAGAAIVVLLLLLGVQTVRLSFSESRLTAAVAERDKFNIQLSTQNEAVKLLVQKGEEQNIKLKAAWKRIADMRDEPTPLPPTPTNCDDAARWAFDQIPILRGKR